MAAIRSRKRPAIPGVTPAPATAASRRADLYSRLGITETDAASAPQITDILRQLPDGGQSRAIEFLRGSSDTDAKKFLAVYDQIPVSSRKLLPIEAYTVAAGLTTKRLLELVTGACFEQSSATAALIAKASHPRIVAATVRSALNVKHGFRDRDALHKHAGFVPVPKTSILNVRGDWNQDNRRQIAIGELSGIEDKQARIANRFNERLGIGASEPPPAAIPAGAVDPDVDQDETRITLAAQAPAPTGPGYAPPSPSPEPSPSPSPEPDLTLD